MSLYTKMAMFNLVNNRYKPNSYIWLSFARLRRDDFVEMPISAILRDEEIEETCLSE